MKQPSEQELLLLLTKAKKGDSEAFEAISVIFAPLLRRLKKSFCQGLCAADCDEISAEAEIALFQAVRNYTEGAGVTFGAYARVCVRNALISYYRKRHRVPMELPIEEWPLLLEEANLYSSQSDAEAAEAVATLKGMKHILSPYEQRVFDLYAEGNSVSQIAKALGKTEKSVSNAVFRLFQKLREQFKIS
ncbi:MAG: sigma-70 family RNA polymerase sigma factor [Clostridia bacterium]|nr:sigma-70 family RNA polymerase sigma factor [Clostridia bacterium]